jgi:hypothetical protein
MGGVSQGVLMNKKILLVMLAIALVFGMTACKDKDEGDGGSITVTVDTTSGRLNITGLDTHNGKYIMAFGDGGDKAFFAGAGVSGNSESTLKTKCVQISGGSATLNVWTWTETETSLRLSNYTGSDTVEFTLAVYNQEQVADEVPSAGGDAEVTFSSGTATLANADISW